MQVYFIFEYFMLLVFVLVYSLCMVNTYLECWLFPCSSFLTASFRSHSRNNELFGYKSNQEEKSQQSALKNDGLNHSSLLEENSYSPSASRSFGDTQLEIFHHQHGLLVLHFLAALMFVPSLVAWLQVRSAYFLT